MLKVPKSDVEVVKGMKSREKTVKVDSSSLAAPTGRGNRKPHASEDAATIISRVQELLETGVKGG